MPIGAPPALETAMSQVEPDQPSAEVVPRQENASLVGICRRQAGLSRTELGERLGVPEHLVALWESPDYEGVDLPMLRRVAAATGRELEIRFTRPQRAVLSSRARTVAAAVLLAAIAIFPGCITETESSLRMPSRKAMSTEGVIVTGDIDEIWTEVQRTVSGMTQEPLMARGVDKSFTTKVNGEELFILVEAYDARRTIVHVNTTNPGIASFIRKRVTLR